MEGTPYPKCHVREARQEGGREEEGDGEGVSARLEQCLL